jgi:hypothetical protein
MNLNNIDISKLPVDVSKKFLQLQVLCMQRKKFKIKLKLILCPLSNVFGPSLLKDPHHRHIAKKFNDLATGKINRLIVNMPPRHTKSEFASYLLPAWMVGRNPKLKIIQATHTGELAIRFGRKAKTFN